METKRICTIESMICKDCYKLSLHDVYYDFYTKKLIKVECMRCKHGKDYNVMEEAYSIGVRFRLGL